MTYNHVSDKDINSWVLETLCIWFKHIDAITDSTNMMFKKKKMEMLLLWNVMQNKKFQYDVKYEIFSSYVLW